MERPQPDDLAREAAGRVTDPELPMLTLVDLGVLRGIDLEDDRTVVTITPTYLGCPAMDTMRADLLLALRAEGIDAEVRVQLDPPWSSDDITEEGRRKLAEHRIAPPGPRTGPVGLGLPGHREVPCPCCGARQSVELSPFGSSACRAIRRCPECGETFDHFKDHRVVPGLRGTA